MRATAVLLDAGGVLLDETEMEAARAEATVRFLRDRVPGYTVERYRADLEEAVQRFVPEAYAYVFWKNVRGAGYDEFERAWRREAPPLRLMEGIDAELRRLARTFRLGLAGQYGGALPDLLQAHGLLDCLAWRYTQADFTLTKPDPRYLLQICERCGVDPRACVMVGDRIDKDVIPAKQVGMRTVRVRTGVHRRQEPRTHFEVPDLELDGVRGLAEGVEALARR